MSGYRPRSSASKIFSTISFTLLFDGQCSSAAPLHLWVHCQSYCILGFQQIFIVEKHPGSTDVYGKLYLLEKIMPLSLLCIIAVVQERVAVYK